MVIGGLRINTPTESGLFSYMTNKGDQMWRRSIVIAGLAATLLMGACSSSSTTAPNGSDSSDSALPSSPTSVSQTPLATRLEGSWSSPPRTPEQLLALIVKSGFTKAQAHTFMTHSLAPLADSTYVFIQRFIGESLAHFQGTDLLDDGTYIFDGRRLTYTENGCAVSFQVSLSSNALNFLRVTHHSCPQSQDERIAEAVLYAGPFSKTG